jgi:hypothetical protein
MRFQCKLGREDIFKPPIGNESLRKISNDNRIIIVDFGTSENVIVKSTVFQNCSFHKYTWTSDGKTHKQIDHILIDKRWHSSVVDD